MSEVPAVEFRSATKAYGGLRVVDDVSLSIARGEFVTIVGTSGSGKTTLLKMVNGLIEPTSGQVFANGRDLASSNVIELRRSIGYAIQGSVLFPHMTVEQNVSYVPTLWNRGNRERTRQAVEKWMGIVGLDPSLLERYPDELSGGQQQRVGIARALAASPDILLMDEPFGAVDEITRVQLQKELRRIHEQTGTTVLFVTHDIREALALATKVLVMDGGRVQQYAEPQELAAAPATGFVRQLLAER